MSKAFRQSPGGAQTPSCESLFLYSPSQPRQPRQKNPAVALGVRLDRPNKIVDACPPEAPVVAATRTKPGAGANSSFVANPIARCQALKQCVTRLPDVPGVPGIYRQPHRGALTMLVITRLVISSSVRACTSPTTPESPAGLFGRGSRVATLGLV